MRYAQHKSGTNRIRLRFGILCKIANAFRPLASALMCGMAAFRVIVVATVVALQFN